MLCDYFEIFYTTLFLCFDDFELSYKLYYWQSILRTSHQCTQKEVKKLKTSVLTNLDEF